MSNTETVRAILNQSQLNVFCKRFGLDPAEIEARTDGWFKLVLLARDRAYLFPRDPRGVERLRRETAVYQALRPVADSCYPRLIEVIEDEAISCYPFAVVTRLKGVLFRVASGLDLIRAGTPHELQPCEMESFLVELARQIADWHDVPVAGIGMNRAAMESEAISHQNWARQVMIESQTALAVEHLSAVVYETLGVRLLAGEIRDLLTGIARMTPVLVHGDVHEDQILVESAETKRITGILDWESARIDNPIWDFDFGEWGVEIWAYHQHFSRFRRQMWLAYAEQRGIEPAAPDCLDAFYTFQEFLCVIASPGTRQFAYTGTGYQETIQHYRSKIMTWCTSR